jgi:hypothetical protein
MPASEPSAPGLTQEVRAPQHLWRGASGRSYRHIVYSLVACPPLPKVSYLLVHRDQSDQRHVLHIGSGESDTSTLNLARLRQRGATLGANEVHVHFVAAPAHQRRLVVCDLRVAQFGALSPEPVG